jgi:hypothetical protein
MITSLIILVLLQVQPDSVRLLEAEFHGVQGVSFVYEGHMESIEPSTLTKPYKRVYQGIFVWRNDGATYLSQYQKSRNDSADFTQFRSAQIGGMLEHSVLSPESPDVQNNFSKKKGSFHEIEDLGTPLRFWGPQFLSFLEYPGITAQEHGWEQIDGHDCLKLTIDLGGRIGTAWFDMERHGHPLRIEWSRKGSTPDLVIQNIELVEFTLSDSTKRWFPIHAEVVTYSRTADRKPFFHESIQVVNGTLRFDPNLKDEMFTVRWDGWNRPPDALSFHRDFRNQVRQIRGDSPRRDPETIQQRLDDQLKEAEQQTKAIVAIPEANQTSMQTVIMQFGLGVIGILIIIIHIFLRMRR